MNMSPAKAQRRKENRFYERGSALRLCAFAGDDFWIKPLQSP